MEVDASIFKSYDIRGIYGKNLDENLAEAVGRGFAKYLNFPKTVVVGRDGRVSGQSLFEHLVKGLTKVGVNVIDIGQVSSDMYYYACATQELPGIMITASHNPKEYNGFKMVKKIPHLLSGQEGIKEIREYIENDQLPQDVLEVGTIAQWNIMNEFLDKILSLVDVTKFKKLTLHADTANGMDGPILERLQSKLPTIKLIPMFWEVDGTFPNHGGDPLMEENRAEIMKRVPLEGSDLGVMFDPDGDRFFVVDKKGRFISGDFMTAILSAHFLKRFAGSPIVYDIRASKVVPDTILANGGKPLSNQVGHTHIKRRMNEEGAVFGGEVSGHYYFKDFYLCDSGIVTMLFLLEFLSTSDKSLDQIVDEMESKYFISGEINSQVPSVPEMITKIENLYAPKAVSPVIKIDGITLEMGDWRFNVRGSNTEPLIRLNLEATSKAVMEAKRDEILGIIRG